MRRCQHPHCRNPLPPDAHHNRRYCDRLCANRHDYIRNREKRKAAERARYHANPEPVRARVREYYHRTGPIRRAQKRARAAMRRRIREAGL